MLLKYWRPFLGFYRFQQEKMLILVKSQLLPFFEFSIHFKLPVEFSVTVLINYSPHQISTAFHDKWCIQFRKENMEFAVIMEVVNMSPKSAP